MGNTADKSIKQGGYSSYSLIETQALLQKKDQLINEKNKVNEAQEN